MKTNLIAALICVIVIMLGVLIFGTGSKSAEAQNKGPVFTDAAPSYLSCTTLVGKDREAIIIVDLRTLRMAGIELVTTGQKLSLRDLSGPDLRR